MSVSPPKSAAQPPDQPTWKVALLLGPACLALVLRVLTQWLALTLGRVQVTPRPLDGPGPYQPRPFDVVCLSHVAWSHIWQRNHHTMTRLARHHQVLYVQVLSTSPVHAFLRHLPGTWTTAFTTHPDLDLIHPWFLPGERRFPIIEKINRWLLRTEIRYHMARRGIVQPVLWFYHPAAVHLLDSIPHAAVVYDIQDEYTAFRGAAPGIAEKEARLLRQADVLLAGTYALHETKKPQFQGQEAAFYPCAVEFGHFHSAAPDQLRQATGTPAARPAPELSDIRGPILFYMGLIDKRIDPAVVEALAAADSTWTIVLAGPVEAGAFPADQISAHHSNVRFLGSIPYRRLPEFLLRTDVCLMPWAVNELTLHINPTKTLEYLATARPVVSIRLPDLEAFYRDTIWLAGSPAEFVEATRWVLRNRDTTRIELGLEKARAADWDTQVTLMAGHVEKVLAIRRKAEDSTKALPG